MANNHFLDDDTLPAEIAMNWKELLPEFGDLDEEELLQHQEIMFQSLKGHGVNRNIRPSIDPISSSSEPRTQRDESAEHICRDQLVLDEAIAWKLYLEENSDHLNSSLPSTSSNYSPARGNSDVSSEETSPPPLTNHHVDHDINPDNMTYEELTSLGESVGSESKGLPKEAISKLQKSIYKKPSFFKRKEKPKCVICCSEFKGGAELILLPCSHRYHSECIIEWFKQEKTCPICKADVSEELIE